MRQAGILGTGHYVPPREVTNDNLSKVLDTDDEWIRTRTGIKARRIIETDDTSDMAAQAGMRAMEMAGITRDDVDALIVATGTPDYRIPYTRDCCKVCVNTSIPM